MSPNRDVPKQFEKRRTVSRRRKLFFKNVYRVIFVSICEKIQCISSSTRFCARCFLQLFLDWPLVVVVETTQFEQDFIRADHRVAGLLAEPIGFVNRVVSEKSFFSME